MGLPREPAQWLAIALALVVLAAARPLFGGSVRPRLFVACAAAIAAALSAAYVVFYLRGGPRIIDATSYFLEARAMADGMLSFPILGPESMVMGRFLLRSEHADGAHAAVIFPPGYPAVLALGFLAGAPLAVGPILAAGVTVATYDLARRVSGTTVARVATALSVVCAALRYHTADTMSHGLAALLVATTLALVFRSLDANETRRALAFAAGAGLSLGWLAATRPFSGLALACAIAFVYFRDKPPSAERVVALAVGVAPGVALLLLHQHAATGEWALSSQRAYYAVSDGPPDCFRYGFGPGIGCLGEHGDFVSARLAGGYGAVAALGTTLRRLKMHLVDPGNLELLALLVPAGAYLDRASARVRSLGVAVLAQIAAYAPFYFDGNYPGGGARLLCDLLPVEHVLAAVAVVALAERRALVERWCAGAVALSLGGFAARGGFDHAALRDRDGGRPLFEPRVLADAHVESGLVLLDSDAGFNLAFDPRRTLPLRFARYHGDALDRAAWLAANRPATALVYRFDAADDGRATVRLTPLDVLPEDIVEGESLWPPLAQQGGWVFPEWVAGTCAHAGRWLELHRAGAAPARAKLALPSSLLVGSSARVRVAASGAARGTIELAGKRLSFAAGGAREPTCIDLPPIAVGAGASPVVLELTAEGEGLVALDAITLGAIPLGG